jgi:signal transduction histidine kinase
MRPHGPPRDWHQRRRHFFLFRAAGVLIFVLVFGAFGLVRAIVALAASAGIVLPPQLVVIALLAVVFGVVSLFFRGMRRVGMPLGDIVEVAERVGSGDFSARLIERGPPFLRTVARAFNTMTARLEANERQRRDLMADVAHELRTPLSIMRGRLEGLVDGVYPRDDRTLTQLVEETKHLERLVEDLRTLAHAEGGTLKLQREATDLAVLVQDVVRGFATLAEAQGVAVSAGAGAELPLIDIDPVRIREVLANLIGNALRHTPRGGRVDVSAIPVEKRIRVRVQDTGAGIHPDDLPRVFDRFAKGVDSSGSGLGLAIARNLVVAHGGDITAESRLGEGTAVTFTLPLAVSE